MTPDNGQPFITLTIAVDPADPIFAMYRDLEDKTRTGKIAAAKDGGQKPTVETLHYTIFRLGLETMLSMAMLVQKIREVDK
jgi:hypothetical protein